MRLIRTVVIGLVASAPIMFGMMAAGAQGPQPPSSQPSAPIGGAITLHGPFEVTAQDMGLRNTPEWLSPINRQAPASGPSAEPDALKPAQPTTLDMLAEMAGRLSEPDAMAPAQPTSSDVLLADAGRIDAVTGWPQSPLATTSLPATGIVSTFYNQGDGQAPASLANVFLSTTQPASLSDALIGQMTVGALASGATLAVTQTFTVPLAMVPGLYYVTVTANANHQFAEYSTTNNSGASAVPILVAHPGPWLPHISR